MPAYNAARTIEKTYRDIPRGVVDQVIVVDDASTDDTARVTQKLGLTLITHRVNKGYGANQKTCYREALKRGADIIVMIHPDYQYDSSLIYELVKPIAEGRFDIMFGSRIRTRKEALAGGMPPVKYVINRIVSLVENLILGVNFTEHMSGFRAYSSRVLQTLPLSTFSDDFIFDQQLMVGAIACGYNVAEYPVPVRYFNESSSIGFVGGCKYILEIVLLLFQYILYLWGLGTPKFIRRAV